MDIEKIVSETSSKLLAGHDGNPCAYPDPSVIAGIIDKLKKAIFPGHFKGLSHLSDIHTELSGEIKTALKQTGGKDAATLASEISAGLLEKLADILSRRYAWGAFYQKETRRGKAASHH